MRILDIGPDFDGGIGPIGPGPGPGVPTTVGSGDPGIAAAAVAQSSLIQIGQAISGAAVPWAYGPCRVRGNEFINFQLADKSRLILHVFAEGPWDGADRLWVNRKLYSPTDPSIHFHPGIDGTIGAGLAATSTGGDQGADAFWALMPAGYQPVTLSRKAYVFVHVQPDPQAPDSSVDIVGDFRTLQVRQFDGSGNQTTFAYSTNIAWWILDAILRTHLNPEWLVSEAAAAGGDLSADQKARINWPSFATSAAWCDSVLANGQKRFEGGLAFPQTVGLQQALDQMCTLSQTYIDEVDGKICLFPDQARASTFILTSDHITAGTFQASKAQLRGVPNRFIATFSDLKPQKQAVIDTTANSGLTRTANVLTVQVPAGQTHPFLVNDNVDIVDPDNPAFAGTIVVTAVPDNRHFSGAQIGANGVSGGGYCGTTESRFAQRTFVVDHEQHQNSKGQRGINLSPRFKRIPITLDLGNNTMERVQRILNFVKARNLGLDQTPYAAPFQVNVQATWYAVDVNGNQLIAQVPGDVLTVDPTISEEFAGDYEIMKIQFNRPDVSSSDGASGQSSEAPTIDLTLKQYLPGAFGDTSDSAQSLIANMVRLGLTPVETVDGAGNLLVSLGKTVDDATSLRFAVAGVDAARKALIDFASAHNNKNVDNVGDGATFGRPLLARLNAGKPWIDFAEAIHLNKILDNIADGGTWGRTLLARLSAGKPWIDFAEGIHNNKHLGNVGNEPGSGRCAWDTSTQKSAAVDTNGNLKLKNIAQATGVSGTVSTTTASMTDVPDMSVTFTASGNKIQILAAITVAMTATPPYSATDRCQAQMRITIGGGGVGIITQQDLAVDSGIGTVTLINIYETTTVAGVSLTIKMQWLVAALTSPDTLIRVGNASILQVTELG
jgi:hypothetical protein